MNRLPHYEQDFAFGQLMLTLRTAIGLTQAGLAEYLGVSRRAIGDWEVGNNYPKPDHLKNFIALAVQHNAFPSGREEEEIRALWRAARQKVLLDETWLASLLAPRPAPPVASQRAQVPQALSPPADEVRLATRDRLPAEPQGGEAGARGERQVILRERRINLPSQPTPFFGRDAEIDEITRILANPA